MDTSLERKIVVGGRRFTGRHRTVGGEEEDRIQSWRNQVTDFMKSRNMAEDRYLWRLGVDGRLLAYIYIYLFIIVVIM